MKGHIARRPGRVAALLWADSRRGGKASLEHIKRLASP